MTFVPKSSKLNSRPVYSSRLYGILFPYSPLCISSRTGALSRRYTCVSARARASCILLLLLRRSALARAAPAKPLCQAPAMAGTEWLGRVPTRTESLLAVLCTSVFSSQPQFNKISCTHRATNNFHQKWLKISREINLLMTNLFYHQLTSSLWVIKSENNYGQVLLYLLPSLGLSHFFINPCQRR